MVVVVVVVCEGCWRVGRGRECGSWGLFDLRWTCLRDPEGLRWSSLSSLVYSLRAALDLGLGQGLAGRSVPGRETWASSDFTL
jgi:hypothetical protein